VLSETKGSLVIRLRRLRQVEGGPGHTGSHGRAGVAGAEEGDQLPSAIDVTGIEHIVARSTVYRQPDSPRDGVLAKVRDQLPRRPRVPAAKHAGTGNGSVEK